MNINDFTQFVQNFKNMNKDPQQMVQELLNSGKMTQAQFNELSQKASAMLGQKMF